MGKCLKCGEKILGTDSEDCNNCNERIQELIQGAMEEDVKEYEEEIIYRETGTKQ